jgi:SAM-dependent methyltransferase
MVYFNLIALNHNKNSESQNQIMNLVIYTILIIVAILVITSFLWRLASSRIEIPCPSWLGWMVEMDNPLSKIHAASQIVLNANIQPGMTVIDAGCGPGRVTIPLAKAVGQNGTVAAMDIQQEMLNKVNAKAKIENLTNIKFIHAALGENKLESNSYDRAFLVTVIGEIPHKKEALREIFNALKPGGTLSITETLFDPHYQRLKLMQDLAKSIGFEQQNLFSDIFSYQLVLQKPLN